MNLYGGNWGRWPDSSGLRMSAPCLQTSGPGTLTKLLAQNSPTPLHGIFPKYQFITDYEQSSPVFLTKTALNFFLLVRLFFFAKRGPLPTENFDDELKITNFEIFLRQ